LGEGNSGLLLGSIESGGGSCEANKTFIEVIEPPTHVHAGIPCGISRDKDELNLTNYFVR
jgi:hypothetical protein